LDIFLNHGFERKTFIFLFLILVLHNNAYAEPLQIRGTIICYEEGENENTAGNIIIVPYKQLDKATLSQANGFYVIPFRTLDLLDKTLTLHYLNTSNVITSSRIFISEENLITIGNIKVAQLPTTYLPKNFFCELIEKDFIVLEKQLQLIRSEDPALKANKTLYQTLAGPTLLGGLAAVGGGLGGGGAAGPGKTINIVEFDITDISPQKTEPGLFLDFSNNTLSRNIGFNFSPNRNLGESVFWNPSVVSFSHYNQINFTYAELSSSVQYFQYAIVGKITSTIGLGLGVINMKQEEIRVATYNSGSIISRKFLTQENALYFSGSYKYDEFFSLGLALKTITQSVQKPNKVIFEYELDQSNQQWTLSRQYISVSEPERVFYDLDLSATYKFNKKIQLGMNIMNIAGSKLYTKNNQRKNIRTLGLGILYRVSRINIGADFTQPENGANELSLGVDYIPLNNMRLRAGFTTSYDTFIIGTEYKFFRYTYRSGSIFNNEHSVEFFFKF